MDKYKHSFAKLWLSRLNNSILINNQDFFKEYPEQLNKIKITPLKTQLKVGQYLLEGEDIGESAKMTFGDMRKKHGLTIYRREEGGDKWRKHQRYIYYIARKKDNLPNELNDNIFYKKSMKIEWDRSNKRIRGVGEDFGLRSGRFAKGDVTPWIYYGRKNRPNNQELLNKRIMRKLKRDDFKTFKERNMEINKRLSSKRNAVKHIDELPSMITEEGDLLCLPKTKVLPKILIVGKSGKGKSWTLNSLLGRIVYIYKDRLGLLNDSLNQFYDLMEPMDSKDMIRELNRIGNEPKHLPTINLYMSCPNVDIKYKDEHVGYRLVVDFKSFLYRWNFFAHGVGKWQIDKSEKYLNKELITELSKAKDIKECKQKLFTYFTQKFGKPNKKGEMELEGGYKNMIMKWGGALDAVFRDQFTSNLFKDEITTAPQWTLKTEEEEIKGHPFLISMEAGLIPVVNNFMAKSKPIARKQITDLINQTIDWQMLKGDDKKRIWICVDELKDFLGKKGDELYQALDYLFTQGRINKLGFIGNVQEYTKLSSAMKANSSHLIIFELQTNEERSAIAKDYGLDKEKVATMADLKTFQCLFTTKEKVVLYDIHGHRREEEGGIWKGKIIPPISVHKSP